jgi:hypothetical protein
MSPRAGRLSVGLVLVALVAGRAGPALADGPIPALIASLPTEQADCFILLQFCHGARTAIARAGGTPPNLFILDARSEGMAVLQVRDAIGAAIAIEQKRGHRLACFDQGECAGIIPPSPPPTSKAKR